MFGPLIVGGLVVIIIILLFVYIRHILTLRNESEYRDIVEYQTMLVAAMLAHNPSLLSMIGKIRYFPDQSGFFVVLNYSGQILVHGDYDGDLKSENDLPFVIPVGDMVELAKNGGGYVRYNYQGHVYQSFVFAYPNSPYIVCSGLFSDIYHTDKRQRWKRNDRTVIRNVSCNRRMVGAKRQTQKTSAQD
jgi:hypothetical protein